MKTRTPWKFLVRHDALPPIDSDALVASAMAAVVGSACLGFLAGLAGKTSPGTEGGVSSARDLRRSAGLLAMSVLLDSAFEHFRGNYENRAMYVAPGACALTLAAAAAGSRFRTFRLVAFGASAVVGAAGVLFHLYNVRKRPGGFSWNNLFYAAPLGAPGGLALAGVLGLSAIPLDNTAHSRATAALRSGRVLTLGTAAALLATSAEVWLLHFRGAFHNPAMYVPVTLPPLTASVLTAAAIVPTPQRVSWACRLLGWTAAMGAIGSGFHVYGVHRNMGGWRNWTQMLFQGPPISAPPSFAAIGLAGLAALRLLRKTAMVEAERD